MIAFTLPLPVAPTDTFISLAIILGIVIVAFIAMFLTKAYLSKQL